MSGVLPALAGLPLTLARLGAGGEDGGPGPLALGISLAATAALAAAGTVLPWRPRFGRALATLAGPAMFLPAHARILDSPPFALGALLFLLLWTWVLWEPGAGGLLPGVERRRALREARALGAATAALGLWLVLEVTRARGEAPPLAAAATGFAVAGILAADWARGAVEGHAGRAATVLVALAAGIGLFAATREAPWTAVGAGAIPALVTVMVLSTRPREGPDSGGWWSLLLGHPERMLVGTFAGLALLGTLVLALPACATGGQSLGILDAAFTAVSAVCVTGLVVRDTATEFSGLGQGIILLLIQLGGLGIMTFSTVVLHLLGRRMSLRHEGALARILSPGDPGRLRTAAVRVLLVTFGLEAAGAAVLFPAFLAAGDPAGTGLWRAVFTSVSAFCNAGFALQTDSLIGYRTQPLVLHTVGVLIVLGGISPAGVLALPASLRRRGGPGMPVPVRIALATTAILLVAGFVLVLAFEWDNTLAGLDAADRLHNAWFQSVTLRTAGFNSVDIPGARSATLVLMMVLMFLGGSPGGTAGGIKTTTAAILILDVVQAIRGVSVTTVFRRRVSGASVRRAAVITTLAAAAFLGGTLALALTQSMPLVTGAFEVMSALGTVGLSIGGTARLDEVGKILVFGCMFVGRVGPLTVLAVLGRRVRRGRVDRPEVEVDVG